MIYSYHSEEPGGSAAEGTPREMQNQEQAIDVRMAEVQSDLQLQSERVAHQAALQVVPTTYPTMYEYCDVCVNRSHDNMLDVCFQDSRTHQ